MKYTLWIMLCFLGFPTTTCAQSYSDLKKQAFAEFNAADLGSRTFNVYEDDLPHDSAAHLKKAYEFFQAATDLRADAECLVYFHLCSAFLAPDLIQSFDHLVQAKLHWESSEAVLAKKEVGSWIGICLIRLALIGLGERLTAIGFVLEDVGGKSEVRRLLTSPVSTPEMSAPDICMPRRPKTALSCGVRRSKVL